MLRSTAIVRTGCLGLWLCSFGAVWAAGQTLEQSNPFLPPGYGEVINEPPPPPQTNGPISRELEFRGIVQLNGILEYSLFHKGRQKGYWLQQNQVADGIRVERFDADSKSITVSLDGRSERLSLMSPDETPLPVAVSTSAPSGNVPPGLPPGIENNPNQNNNEGNRRRVIPRRRVILPNSQ